jgi:SAM-dependent methyltransferase
MDSGGTARAAWSDYWQSGSTEHALPDDSPGTQALAAFWEDIARSLAQRTHGQVLDLACGGGFVSRRLSAALNGSDWQLLALDLAEPALQQLQSATQQHVLGVAGDAGRPPFANASLQAVVSQFGIEYAGRDAIAAAGDLLAPGGELTCLLHHAGSPITTTCRQNARVLETTLSSGLLTNLSELFTLMRRSRGQSPAFKAAEAALQDAVKAVEALIRTGPVCAAMGRVRRLYQDVAQLYSRALAYDPAEALAWIRGTETQLRSYHARMQGMLDAALAVEELETLRSALRQRGLEIQTLKALEVGMQPLAWQLKAGRSAA